MGERINVRASKEDGSLSDVLVGDKEIGEGGIVLGPTKKVASVAHREKVGAKVESAVGGDVAHEIVDPRDVGGCIDD